MHDCVTLCFYVTNKNVHTITNINQYVNLRLADPRPNHAAAQPKLQLSGQHYSGQKKRGALPGASGPTQ